MSDHLQTIYFLIAVAIAALLSYVFKKLTLAGAIAGFLIAVILYFGLGWCAVALMGTFFIAGVGATRYKRVDKAKLHLHDGHSARDVFQVWANGGLAAVLALIAFFLPQYSSMILLLVAAAFSSAAADTVSSELGVIYGKRFYNIISFKKDIRGENGVISIEGTIAGVFASFVIAIVYSIFTQYYFYNVMVIVVAGTVGNFTDSVLGATAERRQLLNNNAVNFLNTVAAVICAFLIL